MLRRIAFLFFCLWATNAIADYPRACLNAHWKPDGCSMPYWAGFVIPDLLGGMSKGNIDYWNSRFKQACDNHDLCYGTHGVGGGQASCDSGFLNEMLSRDCNNSTDKVCVEVARIYYGGVATLGTYAFLRGQDCGCKGNGQPTLSGDQRNSVCN